MVKLAINWQNFAQVGLHSSLLSGPYYKTNLSWSRTRVKFCQ